MSTPHGGFGPGQPGWQPGQPPPGQSYGAPGQPGVPPYGPPPGYSGAPMGYGQPQPPKNSNLKWWLTGGAVLVTIALVGGVAVACSKGDPGSPSTSTTSAAASDIASANDTGPVSLILGDVTCGPLGPITDADHDAVDAADAVDPKIPGSQWTPAQRALMVAAADALDKTADQFVLLAKQTPHRIMRELYEQSIAYYRIFTSSIKNGSYTGLDNYFAGAGRYYSQATEYICGADMTADKRGGLADPPPAPITPGETPNPASPVPYMSAPDGICDDWMSLGDKTNADLKPWLDGWDARNPIAQWSSEDRQLVDGAKPILQADAIRTQALLNRVTNPVLQDFLAFSVLYQQTFVGALDTYDPHDLNFYSTVTSIGSGITMSCRAKP